MASSNVRYLEDYSRYYFTIRYKPNTWPPPFGASWHVIYFKPGCKGAMLRKIKEDVTDILEMLVQDHSDYYCKYEVSEDFSVIRVYETPGGKGSLYELFPDVIGRIYSLPVVYHAIINGGIVSYGEDYIVEFIKPGGQDQK